MYALSGLWYLGSWVTPDFHSHASHQWLHQIFTVWSTYPWLWLAGCIHSVYIVPCDCNQGNGLIRWCLVQSETLSLEQSNRRFADDIFKWKLIDSSFIEACFLMFNCQYTSIVSGDGMAPNKRQAITRINVDQVRWRRMAAPGRCFTTLNATITPVCALVPILDFVQIVRQRP